MSGRNNVKKRENPTPKPVNNRKKNRNAKKAATEKSKVIPPTDKRPKMSAKAPEFKPGKQTITLYNDTEKKVIGLRTMPAPASIAVEALDVFLFTALTKYTQMRVNESLEGLEHGDNDELQFFISSIGQYIVTASRLGPHPVTEVPTWAWVVAAFLQPKTREIGASVLNYTAEWASPTYALPNSYTTPVGTVYWTQSAASNQLTATLTNTSYVLNLEKYSKILRASSQQANRFLETRLASTPMPKSWEAEASAYARNYAYFGTGGTLDSGLYNNCELEVPINFPLFAKFVKYDIGEAAISRHFMPTAGGTSTLAGTMLNRSDFTFKQLRNRIPVVYKFIDFWEIFASFCSYLALQYSTIPDEGGIVRGETFPFGLMDFAIVVRQAVLSLFTEQAEAQFVAPYSFAGSQSYTTFQPLIVDGFTTPSDIWSTCMLPQLLKSNLSFLREYVHFATSKKFKNTKKSQYVRYVPVIGVYKDDVPPNFNFVGQNGNTAIQLFGNNVYATQPFSIADMRIASGLTKYNPNNKAFVSVMTAWNSKIETLAGYSTGVGQMGTDLAPYTSLLMVTRQLDHKVSSLDESLVPVSSIYDKMITGYEMDRNLDKKSKGKERPMAPVPSTLQNLLTIGLHSVLDISTEIKTLFDFLILPCIRLTTVTGANVPALTLRQYKTYTGELHSASYKSGYDEVGRYQDKRVFMEMQSAIIPQGGTPMGMNDISTALKTLEEDGLGGDILGALLGGLLSSVPIIGPIAGNLLKSL